MKFIDITEEATVHPGEYLLHLPSKHIVLCSAFKLREGKIKALLNGRLVEDAIQNFKKVQMTRKEMNRRQRRCGSCKGKR